jgi:hypothetical protein
MEKPLALALKKRGLEQVLPPPHYDTKMWISRGFPISHEGVAMPLSKGLYLQTSIDIVSIIDSNHC